MHFLKDLLASHLLMSTGQTSHTAKPRVILRRDHTMVLTQKASDLLGAITATIYHT